MKLIEVTPLSPEWHEYRKHRITGTDVASIVLAGQGVKTWGTPLSIYNRITGKPVAADQENAFMRWGTATEALNRQEFERTTGRSVQPIGGCVEHPEFYWLACTPDGLQRTPEGTVGYFESKAPGRFTVKQWADGKVPLPYQVQVQIGMCITGLQWGSISALVPPGFIDEDEEDPLSLVRWQDVEPHHAFIDACMEKLVGFWENHIRCDIPPPATAQDVDSGALLATYMPTGEVVTMTQEIEDCCRRMEEAKGTTKMLDQEIKDARAKVMSWMGGAAECVSEDRSLRFKLTKRSREGYVVKATEYLELRKAK